MLKLPDNLTAETFLKQYWQKQPLLMPGAAERIRPAITRNELGWLATLEDVESRLVFVDRDGARTRYRAETGPFESEYLENLPKRDWTLLVHDVEKHLPDMRALFSLVPFIPDWRIDDLMVSFAAPGGGVGPHRDNYDVFLCQGIGVRNWRYTRNHVGDDPSASDDLALLAEFDSDENHDTSQGDVLYLPPGAAHWGTAKRACITYSIGMRAPQTSDLSFALNQTTSNTDQFYRDPDLVVGESKPGYLSRSSAERASAMLGVPAQKHDKVSAALGRFATETKDWLKPDGATIEETESVLDYLQNNGRLHVHGMANIAYDDRSIYVNGSTTPRPSNADAFLNDICTNRSLSCSKPRDADWSESLKWMLEHGAFEIPEDF